MQSSLNGIRAEIEQQFRQWGMTAAEQEVGLLILKGLAHKEIAALRGTSEATVRQQAQAIYRKADLPSKNAFAAYFPRGPVRLRGGDGWSPRRPGDLPGARAGARGRRLPARGW